MCRGQRPARGGPTPGQPSALQQSPCRGLLPPPVPRDSRPRAGLGAKPHSRHWQSALFLKGPPQVTRRHHPAASSPGLRARVGKVQTAPPAPASRPHPCTGTCVAPAPVALLEAPKFHPCLFWKCAETRGPSSLPRLHAAICCLSLQGQSPPGYGYPALPGCPPRRSRGGWGSAKPLPAPRAPAARTGRPLPAAAGRTVAQAPEPTTPGQREDGRLPSPFFSMYIFCFSVKCPGSSITYKHDL